MTFAELFPAAADGQKIDRFAPEALAALSYETELELKNRALSMLIPPGAVGGIVPQPIVPSPLPRGYRTTGKRRATWRDGKLFLHLGRTPDREVMADSRLEPGVHLQIYHVVYELLSQPRNRAAARQLNYCIIRGSYNETALIFNVRKLDGVIVRSLRLVGEAVAQAIPVVRSVFLYVDESASDYYLEAERPAGRLGFKKLFGPECLALKIAGRKFLYPPTVFSQINESILMPFASELSRSMAPQPQDTLLDLYCGYGLWSLLLAERLGGVWGAELSREAIQAARDNAAYHFPGRRMHFESAAITGAYLRENLPPTHGENELILLDPPRQGVAPGVIETLVARRPRRIFHLFCGADEIMPALDIYQANGCRVEALRPFDFFPGTLNVELLAEIRPGAGCGRTAPCRRH